MNTLINKPHFVFLFSIPIFLLIGFLSGESTININVHDTYYVISNYQLMMLISIVFVLYGLGYWLIQKTNSRLTKWMTKTHIGLTFGGTLLLLITSQLNSNDYITYEFDIILNLIVLGLVFLIVIGQIFFPINILIGLFKK